MLPLRTTLALLTVMAALLAARPALRESAARAVTSVFDFFPLPPDAPIEPIRMEDAGYRHWLLDPQRELRHFYDALQRTERREQGAVTRILHYGDSPTTADMITADARDLLQKQFGDAGHGFVLIGQPWAWYTHRGVEVRSAGWKIDPASQVVLRDGMYGIGGASFEGSPGDTARLTLGRGGHTRLELAFLRRPGAGDVTVSAGDAKLATIDTSGEASTSGFGEVSIPTGVRRLELGVERGPVRLFGVDLTGAGQGVVYSSLGLNGGYVSVLAKNFQERHWHEQLRHYRPHLVIVNYGTNESVYEKFVDYVYAKDMKEIVRRLRAALPETSILIMSPMDRGERGEGGAIVTPPVMTKLVKKQEQVARETGVAFFNTFQAMGGTGTMARWYQGHPRLVGADFLHPMPAGAKQIGELLYRGLMVGFHRHKLRRMTGGPEP